MQQGKLSFLLTNGGKIKITQEAIERMTQFIQLKKDDLEAGGVLLGRLIRDSKNIVIDKVSVPMIADKRSRYKFIRNAKQHQTIIDRSWLNSKGTCNYLGEWHTHPESDPEPSSLDIQNWKNRLTHDTYYSRYLYFIIMGTQKFHIWEGDRRHLKFKQLKSS